LKTPEPFNACAVYAIEIDPPEGEEAVSWMLLTTEKVIDISTIETFCGKRV